MTCKNIRSSRKTGSSTTVFRVMMVMMLSAKLVMMLSALQLPSVHHNPSCDGGCTWC